jgi:hypothetical protein
LKRMHVLLLVTVVVGLSAVYLWSRPPEVPPVEEPEAKSVNVTLGIITYDPVATLHFDYIANRTLVDVNAYAASKGFPYRFDFLSRNTANISLGMEKGVVDLSREEGVKIFLGFDSTEYMCASLSYAIHNHLILMGAPLIHHDSSALPGDVMFRVAPNLRQNDKVIASLAETMNLESALVIYRGLSWGDGIYFALSEAIGEDRARNIRYDPKTTDYKTVIDLATSEYASLVEKYGAEHTAVIIEGTDIDELVQEAASRGELLSSQWIVLEESADPYNIEAKLPFLPLGVTNVPLYSVQMEQLLDNGIFAELQVSYASTNPPDGDALSLIDASFRDSIWIACLSVMEANSTDAEVLKGVIPGVANEYTGASGNVFLDINGDRSIGYSIHRFETGSWVKVGEYDAPTGVVILEK